MRRIRVHDLGHSCRADLTEEGLDRTDRIVAVAGVHPFVKLLDRGADVIIAGRCSDSAIFAAPAIRTGFPEALAYNLGKLLEWGLVLRRTAAGCGSSLSTDHHHDLRR